MKWLSLRRFQAVRGHGMSFRLNPAADFKKNGFLLFAEIEVWQHPRQGVSLS
jgi:hypothetical protein